MAAAISRACCALSMTHGPAMNTSGCPPPTDRVPIWTGFTGLLYPAGPPHPNVRSSGPALRTAGRCEADRGFLSCLVPIRRGDEARKQRVRPERLRLELGMELHREEPWVRRDLRDLHELPVGRAARYAHAVLGKHALVQAIELEAMTMAFVNE